MPIVDLTATSVLRRVDPDRRDFRPRVDFTESVGNRAGSGTAEAQVAVVGGAARSGGQDDFAGASARGKIALVTGPSAPGAGGSLENVFAEGAIGALVVGGHLDGGGQAPDGSVFQAANDNASGPAVTIEVARALAAVRSSLVHSVVFVAFAGEEEGFFGSEAYVAQTATTPGRVESLIAMINLDVIGCCGDTLIVSNEAPDLQRRVPD